MTPEKTPLPAGFYIAPMELSNRIQNPAFTINESDKSLQLLSSAGQLSVYDINAGMLDGSGTATSSQDAALAAEIGAFLDRQGYDVTGITYAASYASEQTTGFAALPPSPLPAVLPSQSGGVFIPYRDGKYIAFTFDQADGAGAVVGAGGAVTLFSSSGIPTGETVAFEQSEMAAVVHAVAQFSSYSVTPGVGGWTIIFFIA